MERLIKVPELLSRLGVNRKTFDLMVRKGEFPPPIWLGPRLRRWETSVVEAWMAKHRAAAQAERP